MSSTMTLRMDEKLKEELESLATATRRSKSFLAAEAIRAYVENERWFLAEVSEGQRQARAGMTVSGEEMDELLASLEVERKPKPSKSVRPSKTKRRAG